MQSRARIWLVTAGLALLFAVAGVDVYSRLIVPAAPLNFDEAAHSLEGYYILRDIIKLDFRELWVNTHMQTLWPPGFSYLQAPFLFLFGVSDSGARLFAYVMLALAALMACALAWNIDQARAPVAALVSGLIAVTAPGWLYVGSWANQETPVALVVFVVFWLYLRARESRRWPAYAATGVGLFFLFLTKYNYAAIGLAAVGLVDLVDRLIVIRANSKRALPEAMGMLALLAPVAAGVVFWFYAGQDVVPTAVKWRDFSFFVVNEDSGYPFWSAQNLLFYPRAVADWLMPSGLLAAAALAGAVVAVVRLRRAGLAVLAAFFGIGFFLATTHPLKAERYITPLFPSLWLLTGFGAAEVWRAMAGRSRAQALRGALAAATVAIAVWSWTARVQLVSPVWAGASAAGLRSTADQIVAWQQTEKPVLIVGTFGELGPPLFEWRFRPSPAFAASSVPIQYDAPPGEGSPLDRVRAWARANPGAQITTIQVDPSSALFNTHDMRNKSLWKQQLANAFVAAPAGYRQTRMAVDAASGLTVRYFLPEGVPDLVR